MFFKALKIIILVPVATFFVGIVFVVATDLWQVEPTDKTKSVDQLADNAKWSRADAIVAAKPCVYDTMIAWGAYKAGSDSAADYINVLKSNNILADYKNAADIMADALVSGIFDKGMTLPEMLKVSTDESNSVILNSCYDKALGVSQ